MLLFLDLLHIFAHLVRLIVSVHFVSFLLLTGDPNFGAELIAELVCCLPTDTSISLFFPSLVTF